MVIGRQSDENVGVRCPNRGGITVGKIDAAVGQTYVVDDVVDFTSRNLLSNHLLDLITKIRRFFNAHSGGSTEMKFERAAVYAGEKVAAQPRDQNRQREKTAREEHRQENSPVMETKLKKPAVALSEFLEGRLKALLKAFQRIADSGIFGFSFVSPQQVLGHCRDNCPGKNVRRQHGEHYRFSKRYKEVPRHAGQ